MIHVTGQVSPQLHVGVWVHWRRGVSTMQETIPTALAAERYPWYGTNEARGPDMGLLLNLAI